MRALGGSTGSTSKPVALLASLVAIALGLVAYAAHWGDGLEQRSIDQRFALRGAKAPGDMVFVAVDESTFSELGMQWPFPRSLHAKVIDRLHGAGARAIVYDVQFTEPSKPRQDMALYRAVGRARGTVLATAEVNDGHTRILGGDANLAAAHAHAGAVNFPADPGAVIRRFEGTFHGLPTLGAAGAAATTGHEPAASTFDHDGEAWIDFRGPPGTIRTVSFSDVLRGRVSPEVFRGKTVVVGASAATLQDLHPVSTSVSGLMPGPEIQANAIWTAAHGNPLRSIAGWANVVAIVLGGLAIPLLGLRLRLIGCTAATMLLAGLYPVVAQLAFDSGAIVAVTYPLFALGLGSLATVFGGYGVINRRRARAERYNRALAAEVRARTREVHATQLEIVQRLGQATESRDDDTGAHIRRIGHLSRALGLAVGMAPEEAELLYHASALHDIGKIAVPDRILGKPGPLDAEEWTVMRAHTTAGAAILAGSSSELIQMAETIARTHHERWDGTGYPSGLREDEIPLVGRICAICDVYDALTSPRPYKKAWSAASALANIEQNRGSHFDPELVDAFLALASDLPSKLEAPAVADEEKTSADAVAV